MPEFIKTPEDFFINAAPYQEFSLEGTNWRDAIKIEFFNGTLDVYCIECEKMAVFQNSPEMPRVRLLRTMCRTVDEILAYEKEDLNFTSSMVATPQKYALTPRVVSSGMRCTRSNAHLLTIVIRFTNKSVMKIGQYPSLADIQQADLAKYKAVLEKGKLKEFSKAVGLKAHGVGVGSFVYLRRIFETLIEEAHVRAATEAGWDESAFQQSKMDEKIKLLAHELPEFLVQNRHVYGILSKGIHSLSEDECLQYFDIVKAAIELMLDAQLEAKEKQRKQAAATKSIQALQGQLKK